MPTGKDLWQAVLEQSDDHCDTYDLDLLPAAAIRRAGLASGSRLGGLVAPGSLRWDARTLDLAFTLTDGQASIPVRHKGTAPDLFGEGRGAVVEGTLTTDGYVKATQILAKHSEEYQAPHDKSEAGYKELIKTLRKAGQ